MKSMILLEMKYPKLSKPEATAARNQNSIGDRMEKNLGRNQAQSGAKEIPSSDYTFIPLERC